jgi:serine O-acetyltransferase
MKSFYGNWRNSPGLSDYDADKPKDSTFLMFKLFQIKVYRSAIAATYDMIMSMRADIDRYVMMDQVPWLFIVLTKQGAWLSIQYRISRWVHYHVQIPGLRLLLKAVCAVWRKLLELWTGCEIPNRAEIGPGLFIPHAHGIILHHTVQLGKNCNLSQQVTIGVGGRGDQRGAPTLGDRVFVGPGAKLFGNIQIGSQVAIGANAVVCKDLPDHAVAVGIPAEVISLRGSGEYVQTRDE